VAFSAETSDFEIGACGEEEPTVRTAPEIPRKLHPVPVEVVVEFLVREDGGVEQVTVVSATATKRESPSWESALSAATVEAVINWRYASRAEACMMTQTFRYSFK